MMRITHDTRLREREIIPRDCFLEKHAIGCKINLVILVNKYYNEKKTTKCEPERPGR